MVRRDRSGRPRRPLARRALFRWGPVVLVVALLGGATTAYHYDLGSRWFGAQPDAAPTAPPVPGLTLAPVPTPRAVARPAPSGHVAPAAVRRALAPTLDDPALGRPPRRRRVPDRSAGAGRRPRHVDAGVHPQAPHDDRRPRDARPRPHLRDPSGRRRTEPADARGRRRPVPDRQAAPRPGGARCGEPPGPRGADGARPDRAGASGRSRSSYDTSLFTGPELSPRWPTSYVTDNEVSPDHLSVGGPGDRPRRRQPAGRPGRGRRRAVRRLPPPRRHPRLRSTPTERPAPPGAREVARVTSLPVADIVEQVLQVSDNEGAEVLAHQTGLAVNGHGSFDGGAAAVRQVLTGLGIDLDNAEDLRRQRALARRPARADVTGRGPPARGLRRPPRAALGRRAVSRSRPSTARSRTASTTHPAAAGRGPRPAPCAAPALWPGSSPTPAADRSSSPSSATTSSRLDTEDATRALDDLVTRLATCRC